MASITKRGNNYRITVSNGRDINNKQILKTATFRPDPNKTAKQNEKALQLFALEFENKVKSGLLLDGDGITYADYADIWLDKYASTQMAATTYERSKGILDSFVVPQIGHLRLTEIKPLHIQQIYDDLTENGKMINGEKHFYSSSTLLRIHNVISTSLTQAVYWQLINDNPCKRLRPPKVEKNVDVKHFTHEEAQIFLEYIKKPYKVDIGGRGRKIYAERNVPFQLQVFYNLALFGGFRRGELLALTWSDIDFEHRTVHVNKSIEETQNGILITPPKTYTSIRDVIIPSSCIRLLEQLKEEQEQTRSLIGSDWNSENYLFTQDNGNLIAPGTPNAVFKRIIKRYNENEANTVKLPRISLHGLRHTSATLLIAENIDVKEVSARLGHAETSTTLNIYAHALKKRDEAAANALESLFSK